jgi:hypothetical protein
MFFVNNSIDWQDKGRLHHVFVIVKKRLVIMAERNYALKKMDAYRP